MKHIFTAILISLLLTGCAASNRSAATPPPLPTSDPYEAMRRWTYGKNHPGYASEAQMKQWCELAAGEVLGMPREKTYETYSDGRVKKIHVYSIPDQDAARKEAATLTKALYPNN
jgi:hypothetical protein